MSNWIPLQQEAPPYDIIVETKIDDKDGVRNERQLIYSRGLWLMPDKSTYVYYTPTHWRLVA